MTFRLKILKMHPANLVLASFISAIALATLLLKLPISTRNGHIDWIDALFTATSAVCVTGLTVVDTGSYFSAFGQAVIIVLIQIGGLGVMTISVALFQWIGRSVSIRHRMAMQDLFAHTPREDIFSLVKSIVFFAFGAEALGAVLLTIQWSRELPVPQAAYTAVFHAISAFCNAGFSLFSDSLMRYREDIFINTTICGLIFFGGIGFPVLYELQCLARISEPKRCRLSIQTKTVLAATMILIAAGTLMFAFLEDQSGHSGSSWGRHLMISAFQSITCRTAGFNTVDIASLKESTLAMMIFLMFIGASPGSCGGGVKTTTLALLSAFTLSRMLRKKRVNMFKKSIPPETVSRSVSLVLMSTAGICLVLFLLLVGTPVNNVEAAKSHGPFLTLLFETVSAFGTVGLSMGVTPALNTWGKFWIVAMMVVGRVGILTFAYIIVGTKPVKGIEYSEENLMIG